MYSLKAFIRNTALEPFSVESTVGYYKNWVSEDKYMVISQWNNLENRNRVFAVKCAKRGNDVYRFRVHRRFKGLCSMSNDISFFSEKDRSVKKTQALYITLTNDTKRCSITEAWRMIGVEFNDFMSYVRKKFGKVSCLRVFESFENGYPHIHCILLFEKKAFTAFRDMKGQFRIHLKKTFEKGWHSNIDIKAMNSLAGGLSYLKKYLLKGIDFENSDSKALKTLALCWAYRKRAFSVSGQFRKALSDLIRLMHNSNHKIHQITLSGDTVKENKFAVLGFVPADIVKIKCNIWFLRLNSDQISACDEFLGSYLA